MGMVFTSGQIAINPLTGKLVLDNFDQEVKQVLKNVEAVLNEAGSSKEKIIKLTVFIKDMSKIKVVNEVFELFFINNFPSRSVVEVSELPLNVSIEIEAIGEL